jgi:hypothetical protein
MKPKPRFKRRTYRRTPPSGARPQARGRPSLIPQPQVRTYARYLRDPPRRRTGTRLGGARHAVRPARPSSTDDIWERARTPPGATFYCPHRASAPAAERNATTRWLPCEARGGTRRCRGCSTTHSNRGCKRAGAGAGSVIVLRPDKYVSPSSSRLSNARPDAAARAACCLVNMPTSHRRSSPLRATRTMPRSCASAAFTPGGSAGADLDDGDRGQGAAQSRASTAAILSLSTPGVWFGDAAEAARWAQTRQRLRRRGRGRAILASVRVLRDADVPGRRRSHPPRRRTRSMCSRPTASCCWPTAPGSISGDPSFDRLLAFLGERRAVVFVHPGELPAEPVPGDPDLCRRLPARHHAYDDSVSS